MAGPLARTFDRVGIVARGDLFLVLYGADARLHRTRWLFDRAEDFVARGPGDFLALMVVSADAAPPDVETRIENSRRLAQLGGRLRRLVTVPLGDSLRVHIVRAVMRAMLLVQGQSARHRIAVSESDGIRLILEVATPETPSAAQIRADLAELHAELAQRP